MANKNEIPINYGNLSRFYQNLKNNDLSGIATETYVDNAIAELPQLEAGKNIEIVDNKINAKGYFYDDEKKEELKSIDDILHAAGMPAGQSLGLKISGAAGATTYDWTDDMGDMFYALVELAGMLPGVGATYKTASGKIGKIVELDATTITFEETLDNDNALTNEPVDYVVNISLIFSFVEGVYDYIESDTSQFVITLSGAAGTTTYTYADPQSAIDFVVPESILTLQNGKSAMVANIDKINHTINVYSTFDEENALTNVSIVSVSSKNIATGLYSHTEGGLVLVGITFVNIASGIGAHSEGGGTIASGMCSHTEGTFTTASGRGSHTEGVSTTAQNQGEHAEGTNNVSHKATDTYGDAGNTQHSVGINQKNAFEIMQNGDTYLLGIGGYQGTDTKVQNANIKTLQEYIASLEARIAALEGNTTPT